MFRYSNEYGFLYARDLFSYFLASDFCTFDEDEIILTEEEFKHILKTKEFKEFLIARESDYSTLENIVSGMSFDYDDGFGNLLEINPGKYDTISSPSIYNQTYPTILTTYNDPLFFTHEEDVHLGTIDFLDLLSPNSKVSKPFIKSDANLLLNDFDTIFYLVKPDLKTMITLLRHSYEKDVSIITGLVTNVFDKYVDNKVLELESVYEEVNKIIPGYYEFEKDDTSGTVIRLIHSFK